MSYELSSSSYSCNQRNPYILMINQPTSPLWLTRILPS
jgi:hypothetical protein